jgi:hypothetical protein
MPGLLRSAFLLAALVPLAACNFWVIPIPLGATTLEPVPVEERRDDDSRDDDPELGRDRAGA